MDKLACEAAISDNKVLLYPQAFVGMVTSHMSDVQDNKGPFKYFKTKYRKKILKSIGFIGYTYISFQMTTNFFFFLSPLPPSLHSLAKISL